MSYDSDTQKKMGEEDYLCKIKQFIHLNNKDMETKEFKNTNTRRFMKLIKKNFTSRMHKIQIYKSILLIKIYDILYLLKN